MGESIGCVAMFAASTVVPVPVLMMLPAENGGIALPPTSEVNEVAEDDEDDESRRLLSVELRALLSLARSPARTSPAPALLAIPRWLHDLVSQHVYRIRPRGASSLSQVSQNADLLLFRAHQKWKYVAALVCFFAFHFIANPSTALFLRLTT